MSESNFTPMTLSGLETAEKVDAIFGVCRSGTTAIEKLLTLGGIPAYHQPIKTALLSGVTEIALTKHKNQDDAEPSRVAIKETLGAYSVAASVFNPLEVIRTNVSDNRLQTVFTVKEPFYNFLSWMSMLEAAPPKSGRYIGMEELLGYYVTSCQTLFGIFEESHEAGIPTTVFSYESLQQAGGVAVARQLLEKLDIDPATYSQGAWSSGPSVRDEQSGILYSHAPSVNTLHDYLDASGGLEYCPPNLQILPAHLHATVKSQLTDEGLYDNYTHMLAHA